jgi:hypothetical protein
LAVIILLLALIVGVLLMAQPGTAPEIGAPPAVEQVEGDYSPRSTANQKAMAIYHQSEWDRTPTTTLPLPDENAYHQSEWHAEVIKTQPRTLAWPPRPTQFHPAENVVMSIDENALAVYHQSERELVPIVTRHDREYGLARFDIPENETRPLAWPPRPTQFHPAENVMMSLDENALAAYHQSEWGRTPPTSLPLPDENAYHRSEWDRTPYPTSRLEALRLEAKALKVYHQSEWERTPPTTLPLLDEDAFTKYHQSEWGR